MTLVAALPILLALFLLVGLRRPAIVSMPICATVTLLISVWPWQVPAIRIVASLMEAVAVTASILLIVFGALFFLAVLRKMRAIEVLQQSISSLSNDRRIQAVLVGWIFGSFLEGSSGFGAPAAITAPLLIGLGFRPLQAVVVALVGDSTAVSFGAIGTPMLIGFGEGLEGTEGAPAITAIGLRIARLDLLLGTIMPVILVLTLVISSDGVKAWKSALPALPFAAFVGFVQAFASFLIVATVGPELPSLIGPMAGFVAALFLLRMRWLVPTVNASAMAAMTHPTSVDDKQPSLIKAIAPYLLLVVLLVITRVRALPVGTWLKGVEVGWADLFDTGISAQLQPLYSPGAVFVLCGLLSAWYLRASLPALGAAAWSAGQTTLKTAAALVAAIITVRLFLQSGGNAGGFQSMPLVLAESLASSLGGGWQGIAPAVGSLGSFMSGSATFSNMLFALLQFQIATDLGYDSTEILALQGVGAAAGNMTCIHNVVAACAVAGILGEEGNVIRRTAIPMFVYLLLAALLGVLA